VNVRPGLPSPINEVSRSARTVPLPAVPDDERPEEPGRSLDPSHGQSPVVVPLEDVLPVLRRPQLVGLEPGGTTAAQPVVAILPVGTVEVHRGLDELVIGHGDEQPDVGAEKESLLGGQDVGAPSPAADEERPCSGLPRPQGRLDLPGHSCLTAGREPWRNPLGMVDHVSARHDDRGEPRPWNGGRHLGHRLGA
jgi:hypothetical protein